MFTWINLKAKIAMLGTILLGALAFIARFQYLKASNERLKVTTEVLEARVEREKVLKKEKKKIREEFRSRETELLKELEKDLDEFKGIDNLSDPDNW